jgi:short-subunit dehydrogenase
MSSFKGEHVWIIGASSGIGRALAIELAARGAVLALSARSIDKLGDLVLKIGQAHTFHPLDVTDPASIEKAIAAFPRIPDRVIYMAGQYEPMAFSEMNLDKARSIVDVNLTGAINVISLILPLLLQRKSGQIAITASVAGYLGLPKAQPYGATKAALINLSESLALELRDTGIDVKVINPGFVRTDMTAKNTFSMPMMIEPEAAARAIADGLTRGGFEIHFPKRFTWLVKIMSWLPQCIFSKMAPR